MHRKKVGQSIETAFKYLLRASVLGLVVGAFIKLAHTVILLVGWADGDIASAFAWGFSLLGLAYVLDLGRLEFEKEVNSERKRGRGDIARRTYK